MTSEEVETLRLRYKPAYIGVLFVGESAPTNGKFVYDRERSELRRAIKVALTATGIIGEDASFHDGLKANHVYIDDLVLVPVNEMSKAERLQKCEESVSELAKRLRNHRPRIIVSLLKQIEPFVERARREAGLDVPHHAVCFPAFSKRNYDQFQREMFALREEFHEATRQAWREEDQSWPMGMGSDGIIRTYAPGEMIPERVIVDHEGNVLERIPAHPVPGLKRQENP